MKQKFAKFITGAALIGAVTLPALQATPALADKDDHYKHDNGHHTGWTKGQHRGWNKNINARQHRQDARIYSGVRNGSLNHREYNRIEKREDNIARAEARDRRSGGKLTAREHRNIEHRLNGVSHEIHHDKHDHH